MNQKFDFSKLAPGAEVIVQSHARYGMPGMRVIGTVVRTNHRGNVIVMHSGYQQEFRASGSGAGQNHNSLICCTPEKRQEVLDEVERRQLLMQIDRVQWRHMSLGMLRAVWAAAEANMPRLSGE